VQGVAEQMEQEIELIVSCNGLLTRVVGVFIVLKTRNYSGPSIVARPGAFSL